MKHTLSVLVEDESGVLTRIAGLFARRGYNIESLSVAVVDVKAPCPKLMLSSKGVPIIVVIQHLLNQC